MPLTPYTGTFGTKELVHLLKRTTFGAKQSDIAAFAGMSLSQVVDSLLDTSEPAPSPPLKDYPEATQNPDTNIALGTTWVNDINLGNQVNNGRRNSYKKWWLGLMLNQAPTIREKLTLFWVNHFGNEAQTVSIASPIYEQNALLRGNCLGDFKAMVKDMTLDPAMLRYLNGYLNNRFAPDENYARELQELFTLGKDDAVGYTEADVQAAARVLTGWSININTLQTVYNQNLHEPADKTFSPYYGNQVITGDSSANGGMNELDQLLSMIFAKQEVAKFIVRKLYRWFVYYEITPQIEVDVIEPLANTFRSNYQIRPMLVELFNSAHFFDLMISQGAVIKAPVDFMVGAFREFDVQYPPASDWDSNYQLWGVFGTYLLVTGQDLHNPPNVAGYPAYYQAPGYHELWINADTITKRNELIDYMLYIGATINGNEIKFDVVSYASSFSNPGDPNQLIADAVDLMYRIDLSQAAKDQIKKDILLSGQSTDAYWTSAWFTYQSDPSNATYELIVTSRLQALFKHLMNLEEYQLS